MTQKQRSSKRLSSTYEDEHSLVFDGDDMLDQGWQDLERGSYDDVLQDCSQRYRDQRFR